MNIYVNTHTHPSSVQGNPVLDSWEDKAGNKQISEEILHSHRGFCWPSSTDLCTSLLFHILPCKISYHQPLLFCLPPPPPLGMGVYPTMGLGCLNYCFIEVLTSSLARVLLLMLLRIQFQHHQDVDQQFSVEFSIPAKKKKKNNLMFTAKWLFYKPNLC